MVQKYKKKIQAERSGQEKMKNNEPILRDCRISWRQADGIVKKLISIALYIEIIVKTNILTLADFFLFVFKSLS